MVDSVGLGPTVHSTSEFESLYPHEIYYIKYNLPEYRVYCLIFEFKLIIYYTRLC